MCTWENGDLGSVTNNVSKYPHTCFDTIPNRYHLVFEYLYILIRNLKVATSINLSTQINLLAPC